MARLTPEQEAAYALDYGVSRAGLKPQVQAEYDRVLAERRAGRPAGMLATAQPLPAEYRRPGIQSRRVLLRADLIRIWHGQRFINIGMSEIAGVGLLFSHVAGSRGDWHLFIWRDFGPPERTELSYHPWPGYDNPVANSDLPALAASRAAAACRDIYERVLAAQGSDGPLATRQLHKHQPPFWLTRFRQVTAYWSPDGEAGYCRQQPGAGEVDLPG